MKKETLIAIIQAIFSTFIAVGMAVAMKFGGPDGLHWLWLLLAIVHIVCLISIENTKR